MVSVEKERSGVADFRVIQGSTVYPKHGSFREALKVFEEEGGKLFVMLGGAQATNKHNLETITEIIGPKPYFLYELTAEEINALKAKL